MNVQYPTPISNSQLPPAKIVFVRSELSLIMNLYGRMVSAGEWRDYGMSFLKETAVFSVYRHAAEIPVYRIEKQPEFRNKQGQYSVKGADGRFLKRGHDLKTVLRILERNLIRLVD